MSGSRETVASAYPALLARRGVEVLFGNGGTDFAPIIEAYAEAPDGRARAATDPRDPREPRRHHGSWLRMISRNIPAVMVHVSVGTANMVCPAMKRPAKTSACCLPPAARL